MHLLGSRLYLMFQPGQCQLIMHLLTAVFFCYFFSFVGKAPASSPCARLQIWGSSSTTSVSYLFLYPAPFLSYRYRLNLNLLNLPDCLLCLIFYILLPLDLSLEGPIVSCFSLVDSLTVIFHLLDCFTECYNANALHNKDRTYFHE